MGWITVNDRFNAGILVINEIQSHQVKDLMKVITNKLENRQIEPLFTHDETKNLLEKYNIKLPNFEKIVYTLKTIIVSASYANIDAATMRKTVKTFNLSENTEKTIVDFWFEEGENVIQKLKNLHVWPNLIHIKSSQNVEISSSIRTKQAKCNTQLELELGEGIKINVELDKEGLEKLYYDTERIVAKLDKLLNK